MSLPYGRSWKSKLAAKRTAAAPSARPSAPATAVSRTFSTTSCRASCQDGAPSARRVAISLARTFERTSARFATFRQPISSTKRAPPQSRYRIGLTWRTRWSGKRSTFVRKPALISSSLYCGKRSRLAALSAFTCACACARVAPGLSRPTFHQLLLWRRASDFCSAVNASGRQRLTPGASASKARGITPTTVYGWPSMRRSLPTAPGSAAKRLRQSPSLSSTFFSFPGSPSSLVNGRPSAGAVRITRRYDGVTFMTSTRTGRPSSSRLTLPVLKSACSS